VHLEPADKETALYSTPEDERNMSALVDPFRFRKKIVIHPSISFPTMSWPSDRWQRLTELLLNDGFMVIAAGKDVHNIDNVSELVDKKVHKLASEHEHFLDVTNRLTLHELYALIKKSDLVITMDSGVLHVANCTDTYIIAIFSCIDPRFRMRFKNGRLGYKTTPVSAFCPFQYCASKAGGGNQCKQTNEKRLCCLPSVDELYNCVKRIFLISHIQP
jgi:ADP-heptose:LPS heptosyltransferase